MDYKKTSILLKKIKSLHNTLMDNADHPSSIEKQLMQSYLRDFYDSFVSGEGATDIFAEEQQNQAQIVETKPVTPVEEQVKQSTPTMQNVPLVTPLQNPVNEITTEPIVAESTPVLEKVAAEEVIEQNPAGVSPVAENQVTVERDKQAEAITDEEMVIDGKDIAKQLVTDPVDQDLLALFSESPVEDLSDKLALLPIRDLTKALSINERFFTIQELFGGDSDLFQSTLSKLNGLSNFNQASKELINSVATEFDWSSEQKQKKAAHFIKLVRRRYQ